MWCTSKKYFFFCLYFSPNALMHPMCRYFYKESLSSCASCRILVSIICFSRPTVYFSLSLSKWDLLSLSDASHWEKNEEVVVSGGWEMACWVDLLREQIPLLISLLLHLCLSKINQTWVWFQVDSYWMSDRIEKHILHLLWVIWIFLVLILVALSWRLNPRFMAGRGFNHLVRWHWTGRHLMSILKWGETNATDSGKWWDWLG